MIALQKFIVPISLALALASPAAAAPPALDRTTYTTPAGTALDTVYPATTSPVAIRAVVAPAGSLELERSTFTSKPKPKPKQKVVSASALKLKSVPVQELTQKPMKLTARSMTAKGASKPVVATAMQYLGVPYVWGGTNPAKGLDCSGLVQLVYARHGVQLPRVARDQARQGVIVPTLAQAQPGDLIGMRNGSHIAIYIGDGKILHSPQPGSSVSIRSLASWDDIDTIRRIR